MMKLRQKVDDAFADRSREFWIGFWAALGIDLFLAALVMYVTLELTPKSRRLYGAQAINPEIPLAILIVVINLVGLAVLARRRHQLARGALMAFWIVVGLVACFGCSVITWALLTQPL